MAESPVYPNRLGEFMEAAGVTDAELGRLINMGRSGVGKLRKGTRKLTKMRAKSIAPVVGLSADEWFKLLLDDDETTKDLPLVSRRFLAVVWAKWGDDVDEVHKQLGVDVATLEDVENGAQEPGDTLLTRVHMRTGVPLWWFSEGRMDGIEAVIAGRIGAFDAELIPDAPRV